MAENGQKEEKTYSLTIRCTADELIDFDRYMRVRTFLAKSGAAGPDIGYFIHGKVYQEAVKALSFVFAPKAG